MKKTLIFYLLIGLVSANTGYLPISIISNDKYSGFDYCEIGQPCKYINLYQQEQEKTLNIKALKYTIFSFIGVIAFSMFLIYSLVKIMDKRFNKR